MVVGNMPEAADFVVVGAGPGGYAAALHAARAGRRVTLVDRDGAEGVGGVCLNTGCIPSKTLIEAADLDHRLRASTMGLAAPAGQFRLAQFQIHKGEVVTRLTQGVRALLEGAGVEVVRGSAALSAPDQLVVDAPDAQAKFLQFRALVLATGSAPVALPDLPFDHRRVLDSTDFLALDTLPASLAVVGGGYIGLELGTAAAKLGVPVSIIELQDQLLPGLAPSLAALAKRRLDALGMSVHLGHRVQDLDGEALIASDEAGKVARIPAERVLVAAGRRANTAGLGLELLSVELEQGRVPVAEDRRITDRIAAIGDLTPGPALAHKASAEALVAVQALNGENVAFEPAAIPLVVFSDPEIASAGLCSNQAAAAGIDTVTTRVPLGAIGRAATVGAREGMIELVHARDDGTVLGVHIAAPHASELISEGVLAIEMGASVEDLALTVHAHPTFSELTAEAAELAAGHPLHVNPVGTKRTT